VSLPSAQPGSKGNEAVLFIGKRVIMSGCRFGTACVARHRRTAALHNLKHRIVYPEPHWNLNPPAVSFPTLQSVHLVLHIFPTCFDGAAVQVLDRALGASLKQLTLDTCNLDSTFGPALATSLPGLQVLELGEGVAQQADVASFCRSRAVGPVRVRFGKVDLVVVAAGEPAELQH
jgi:hypothetical protein